MTSKEIGDVIALTGVLAREGRWDDLSAYINQDWDTLDPTSIVAILRSTYPMRTKLPRYEEMVLAAHGSLLARGVTGLLRGLHPSI